MSKIYEALQNAQAQHKELPETTMVAPKKQRTAEVPMAVPRFRMEAEMLMLYHSVCSMLPGYEKMTLQFIASHLGEGTSTVVREFAHMAASRLGKSVLVLDAGHGNTTFASYGVPPSADGDEPAIDAEFSEQRVHETQHENVFLSPLTRNMGSFMQSIDNAAQDDFIEQLKAKHDLILVDSPPASENPTGFAFCRKVDGVVLIVEADKTRWPVVEALKNRIIGCGGRVLGVVLNKRRYDIPGFVYSRL